MKYYLKIICCQLSYYVIIGGLSTVKESLDHYAKVNFSSFYPSLIVLLISCLVLGVILCFLAIGITPANKKFTMIELIITLLLSLFVYITTTIIFHCHYSAIIKLILILYGVEIFKTIYYIRKTIWNRDLVRQKKGIHSGTGHSWPYGLHCVLVCVSWSCASSSFRPSDKFSQPHFGQL